MKNNPNPSDGDIVKAMNDNLCRDHSEDLRIRRDG